MEYCEQRGNIADMKILSGGLRLIAVAFLSFLVGSYIMFAEAGPAEFLKNTYEAGQALIDKHNQDRDPYLSRFHRQARTTERGVTRYDPENAQNGFTLYTSGHDQRAILISMKGDVLHEWDLPFSAIWDERSPVNEPRDDAYIFYRRAHLYPNGDLLVIYSALGDTPWGYGAARMTKDSDVVWSYLGQAHHDFDIGRDGEIYLLTHEIRDNIEIAGGRVLEPPRIDDFIVVLSPTGEQRRKVNVTKALIDSVYSRLLRRVSQHADQEGDYLHTNSIDLIDADDAKVFPFGEEGHVLISMRELGGGAIATIDMTSETITWATQGPWIGQHDPDITRDGNLLLFDNHGYFNGSAQDMVSRVIEFDPTTYRIVWEFAGDADDPLDSNWRSGQVRLQNGNTLITESAGGRLLEVTPDKDIVWEFINPVRAGENNEYIPIVASGERISPESLDPTFLLSLRSRGQGEQDADKAEVF